MSYYPRDGTGFFFFPCRLSWLQRDAACLAGVFAETLKIVLEVCCGFDKHSSIRLLLRLWYRNDHPCWLKPVAKGCCFILSFVHLFVLAKILGQAACGWSLVHALVYRVSNPDVLVLALSHCAWLLPVDVSVATVLHAFSYHWMTVGWF